MTKKEFNIKRIKKQCMGKVGFQSLSVAKLSYYEAISNRNLSEKERLKFGIYKCSVCNLLHIGKSNPGMKHSTIVFP